MNLARGDLQELQVSIGCQLVSALRLAVVVVDWVEAALWGGRRRSKPVADSSDLARAQVPVERTETSIGELRELRGIHSGAFGICRHFLRILRLSEDVCDLKRDRKTNSVGL